MASVQSFNGTLAAAPVPITPTFTGRSIQVTNKHATNEYTLTVDGNTYLVPANTVRTLPLNWKTGTINGTGDYVFEVSDAKGELKSTPFAGINILDGTVTAAKLGSLRVPELSAGAEIADVITVTVQVLDASGVAVAEATRIRAEVVGELAAAYTIGNVAIGTQLGTNAANPIMGMVTDANGIVAFDVTDVASASGVAVCVTATTMGTDETGVAGITPYANSTVITFD